MSKLDIRPSPNPKGFGYTDSAPTPAKRKRDFEVVDTHALYALYPQFFKLVPDYAKIRQAKKLGLPMPGVAFADGTGSDPHDEDQSQPYQGE